MKKNHFVCSLLLIPFVFMYFTVVEAAPQDHELVSDPSNNANQEGRDERVTQFERLIRDLDSSIHRTRETATRRLNEALLDPAQFEAAMQSLRAGLGTNPPPSLEARRRMQQLLERSTIDWPSIGERIRGLAERHPAVRDSLTAASRVSNQLERDEPLKAAYSEWEKARLGYDEGLRDLKNRQVPKNDPRWLAAERDYHTAIAPIQVRVEARTAVVLRDMGAQLRGALRFEGESLLGDIVLGGITYKAGMSSGQVRLTPQNFSLNGRDIFTPHEMTALQIDPHNAGRILLPPAYGSFERIDGNNMAPEFRRNARWTEDFGVFVREQLLTTYPRHFQAIRALPTRNGDIKPGFDRRFRTLPE